MQSKNEFLEIQEKEAQDRLAMAEKVAQEHMASGERLVVAKGELSLSTTCADLIKTGLNLIETKLVIYGLTSAQSSLIMSAIVNYGDCVRLDAIEKAGNDVELFGQYSELNPQNQ